MDMLSNEVLIEAYFRAKELRLEQDFIDMLLEELHCRNLTPELERSHKVLMSIC
ncbi:sporulation histidine kinase inhibitor Sda [Halalkalibacter urbisdiaboli]|uniref:sporulation histidine kinase inhibitor Sda n=1 Tax=Halalkalibacter urbisdiaboli TaxID=1960589 RepID=UPI000B441E79|nr:sporulation histidine kinase inhibitor Sda [Halalkalibacter urbisdiaboli]